MKNKTYATFKSENKVKISLNFGFSHSLTYRGFTTFAAAKRR
jgi:hypothetical protein